jgi:hypothetical protein
MEPASLRAANERRAARAAAKQVAQARAALSVATDRGHIRVLIARIENPQATLADLAASMRMSKDSYAGRLRRALATPGASTRVPIERSVVTQSDQRSPRSARAIRIGTGRGSNLGVRPIRHPRGTAK